MIQRVMKAAATAAAALAVAAVAVAVPSQPRADAQTADWQAPVVTRLIGGPSEPHVFAWGIDYDPVRDQIVVSDYLNRQLRRFDRDGRLVESYGDSEVLGFYAGVAVDPSDGTTYTHTFGGNSDYIRFAPDGSYAGRFDAGGLSAFLTFGPDGHLYGNSHKCCSIKKIDVTPGAERVVQRFGTKGTGPGQVAQVTGVAVASDGRVFAVDPGQGKVHVWAADGSPVVDFADKGPGRGLLPGDARGIALDEERDRVYVADSDEGQIEIFTLDGAYVDTWASIGTGPGQFSDGARELVVAPDGNLWAADYGGARVQEISPEGTVLGVYPAPPRPADPWGFSRPRDAEIDPLTDELLVADPWNQRISRFTTEGELVSVRGRRGSQPPDGLNYPRSVGVDPVSGNTWIANYEGVPGLTVLRPDGSWAFNVEVPQFANDVQFHDGEVYVPFRGGDGVLRIFDATDGRLTRIIPIGAVLNGVAIDPATGNIYVALDGAAEVRIYDPAGLQIGALPMVDSPWGVMILDGVVYVTDTEANEIRAFDLATWELLGAFGVAGNRPGDLRNPSGLDHDAAGNIYVAEAGNNRISVFSPTTLPADSTAPTVTIDSPAAGSTVGSPLAIEGSAADVGAGVGQVEVMVLDRNTGLWWDADRSVWGSWKPNAAAVYGDLNAASWHFGVVGAEPGGSYWVQARVRDLAGNLQSQRRSIVVDVVDEQGPQVSIESPAAGPVPEGPIAMSGSATDDQGVASVEVKVVDVATGDSWDPDTGTWVSDTRWTPAALAAPNATASSWQLSTTAVPAAGTGELAVSVRGVDVAANVGPEAVRTFERGGVDEVAPDTELRRPQREEVFTGTALLTGTVRDDVAAGGVEYAIQDRTARKWLDASDGTYGGFTWNAAPLTTSGAAADFEVPVDLADGSYWVSVRGVDAAGNIDPSPAGNRFTVTAEPDPDTDTTAPTITYDQPVRDSAVTVGPVLGGSAADDRGVEQVDVAILDRQTQQWWDESTNSFGASFTWNPTTVAEPGATTTAWSLASELPVGNYWSTSRAIDAAGNQSNRTATRFLVEPSGSGLVNVDRWDGFGGIRIDQIPTGTPPTVSYTETTPAGLSIDTDADDFGARVRVLVTPPETGDYTFWVSSDDHGSLRIDPNGTDPAAATEIASVSGWTGLGSWFKYASQQSAPIRLEAGQQYYLEAVFKEKTGGDHIQVAWQRDGTDAPQLVPSSALALAGDLGLGGWEE